MCLCILGIIIFITLIVDINKYISMMKTYWQKGGKQIWNQLESSLAIMDLDNCSLESYCSIICIWSSSWGTQNWACRRWRRGIVDKYSNICGSHKITSILWIYKWKTFWINVFKDWRCCFLCTSHYPPFSDHCQRGINCYSKVILKFLSSFYFYYQRFILQAPLKHFYYFRQ